MRKKRYFEVLACVMVVVVMLSGCSIGCSSREFTKDNKITVITREEGSGTREAFVKIFNVVDKNGYDMTTASAELNSSTSVVLASVKDNPSAIAFVSLGTINDEVKIVKVDGIMPSSETVKNGTYPVTRSFNVAFRKDISAAAEDFLDFVMSKQGKNIVEAEGYIGMDGQRDYEKTEVKGTVKISGSTSVAPVMKVLAEEYEKINTDVDIQVSEGGSSAGITSTIEGVCDIGMASRDLKESEMEQGLEWLTVAVDGIAVIANKNNYLADELTSEVIRDIYLGVITDWTLDK